MDGVDFTLSAQADNFIGGEFIRWQLSWQLALQVLAGRFQRNAPH